MLFQGIFKRAERTIDSAIARFVDRATVAVPLLVAGGFATAALSLKLIELYGAVSAYALMAVLFATIGLITMAVNARSHEVAAEAQQASDSGAVESEQPAEGGGPSLPPEMMSLLSSIAPAAAPGIARGIVRNLPLIFMLALVAFVVSRFAEAAGEESDSSSDEEPDAKAQNAA